MINVYVNVKYEIMDMENITIMMDHCIKVNGSKICNMVKDLNYFVINQHIKEVFNLGKDQDMVFIDLVMNVFIKVNLKIINLMDMGMYYRLYLVFLIGQMVEFMKENGKMIRKMERVK